MLGKPIRYAIYKTKILTHTSYYIIIARIFFFYIYLEYLQLVMYCLNRKFYDKKKMDIVRHTPAYVSTHGFRRSVRE